jgi:hypothetical protein
MNEQTTTFVASGAITSYWWLPALQAWSEVAALLLPVLGATWLVVQIVFHVMKHTNKGNK